MAQHSQTVSATTPPFRFLDLSAELRNAIYDFTLSDTKRITTPDPADSIITLRNYKLTNLLLACRQIRNEYKDRAQINASTLTFTDHPFFWHEAPALSHLPKVDRLEFEIYARCEDSGCSHDIARHCLAICTLQSHKAWIQKVLRQVPSAFAIHFKLSMDVIPGNGLVLEKLSKTLARGVGGAEIEVFINDVALGQEYQGGRFAGERHFARWSSANGWKTAELTEVQELEAGTDA